MATSVEESRRVAAHTAILAEGGGLSDEAVVHDEIDTNSEDGDHADQRTEQLHGPLSTCCSNCYWQASELFIQSRDGSSFNI